jgi:hypothetical protein
MTDRVRWIRSYVVEELDGRLGTICIYQANDLESIREHARRVGIPGDDALPIVNTVVDPPRPRQKLSHRLRSAGSAPASAERNLRVIASSHPHQQGDPI